MALPAQRRRRDVALVHASNHASATIPTIGTGYTANHAGGAQETMAHRGGRRVLDGTETTTSGWSNAGGLIAAIYRNVDNATPVSSIISGDGGTANDVNWPAKAMERSDGSSAIILVAHSDGSDIPDPAGGAFTLVDARDSGRQHVMFERLGATAFGGAVTSGGTVGFSWQSGIWELLAAPSRRTPRSRRIGTGRTRFPGRRIRRVR